MREFDVQATVPSESWDCVLPTGWPWPPNHQHTPGEEAEIWCRFTASKCGVLKWTWFQSPGKWLKYDAFTWYPRWNGYMRFYCKTSQSPTYQTGSHQVIQYPTNLIRLRQRVVLISRFGMHRGFGQQPSTIAGFSLRRIRKKVTLGLGNANHVPVSRRPRSRLW